MVYIPKIFVVCDRSDTAPVWGYILRQQGLIVILEMVSKFGIDTLRLLIGNDPIRVINLDPL